MLVINQATGPIINEIFTNYDIWRYNGRYSGMMGCNSKPWIAEDAALGSEWVGNLQGIVFVWNKFNKIDSRSGVNPKVSKDSPRKLIFCQKKEWKLLFSSTMSISEHTSAPRANTSAGKLGIVMKFQLPDMACFTNLMMIRVQEYRGPQKIEKTGVAGCYRWYSSQQKNGV